MPDLFLTPASISSLSQLILAGVASLYLLHRARKLPLSVADYLLLGFILTATGFIFIDFADNSFYLDWRIYFSYLQNPVIACSALFLLLFAYNFPTRWKGHPMAPRAALAVSGLYVLWETGLAVDRFARLLGQGAVTWRPPAADLPLPLIFTWAGVVLLRQAADRLPGPPGAARVKQLWRSQDHDIQSTRAFALVLFGAMVLALVRALEGKYLPELVVDPIFSIGMLVVTAAYVWSYLNHRPETTSIMVKLLGGTLLTVLMIAGGVGWLVAPVFAGNYHDAKVSITQHSTLLADEQHSVRFTPNLAGGYDIAAIPFYFEKDLGNRLALANSGQVAIGFSFPFYDKIWQETYVGVDGYISFGRPIRMRDYHYKYGSTPVILPLLIDLQEPPGETGAGIFTRQAGERFIITWYQTPEYRPPHHIRTFQLVLYKNGTFDITYNGYAAPGVFDVSDPLYSIWLLGALPGRSDLAPEMVPAHRDQGVLHSGPGGVIEDHYRYFRAYLHPLFLLLAGLVAGSSLFLFAGFPIIFRLNLINPLNQLLEGVRQVNAGNLQTQVPVQFNDEIGFLTGSFNNMIRSINETAAELRHHRNHLEELVAERTATLEQEIRDRNKAEQALLRLSQVVEQNTATIVITGTEGAIEYVNPKFTQLTGYELAEVVGQNPRILKSGHTSPEEYERLWATIKAGEVWRGEFYNKKKDGEYYWETAVISPITDAQGQITHFVAVKEDITRRRQAEQDLKHLNEELEERVKTRTLALSRRAAELEALSRVSSALRRARNLDEMLPTLVREAAGALKADGGAVLLLEHDELVVASLSTLPPAWQGFRRIVSQSAIWEKIQNGQPQFISALDDLDLLGDALASDLQAPAMALAALRLRETPFGILVLFFESPHRPFSEDDRRLLVSIVDIAVNALDRANLMDHLEQRVIARTQELTTLYNIASVIGQSMDLPTVCKQILCYVLEAMNGDAGLIHLRDEQGNDEYQVVAQAGLSPAALDQVDKWPMWYWVVEHKEPLIVQDLFNDNRFTVSLSFPTEFPAYIGVPVRSQQKVLGVVSVFGRRSPFANLEDLALLSAVADQLTVAVDNAKLRNQAKDAAITAERQRLARELHDSVTQLLYSQVLFADAGHKYALKGDLDQASHYLGRLFETSLQALKEMRLMIYELRPSLLASEGLIGALQYRLETVEQRAGIKTSLQADKKIHLPGPVEKGLYGIAQETLNNALKHAQATAVTVSLLVNGEQVELEISDNGKGFDPATVHEGIGFSNLRERAAQLGGALTINSEPGAGTRIVVCGPWLSALDEGAVDADRAATNEYTRS